ncbi:MAG: MFS transporter [Prolixibacteraceae bacterium]
MTNINSGKQEQNRPVSGMLVGLMAVSAGVSVANIYYNQPILNEIAAEFGSTEAQAGMISMLSQVGYGLGLFFLTPLGDKVNKKSLIVNLQFLLALVLVLIVFTKSMTQLWVLSVLIGMLSVSVQVIMPMAAGLDPKNRGRIVGTIFTGLLIGVLAARVFSGSIAAWFGWRYVFLLSAIAVTLITILLKVNLPDVKTPFSGTYIRLLGSAIEQVKRFPVLRHVSAIGMLQFGLFCSFWTTLTFHLSGSPFHFQSSTIGLFGLVAIAGALLAPLFGKKADQGGSKRIRLTGIGMTIAGILLMLVFPVSVVALVLTVLLLDIAAQAIQVTNVAKIYMLDESFHSRINTIYMTSFFAGGALGTLTGVLCWHYGGWTWVNIQMLILSLAILALLMREKP